MTNSNNNYNNADSFAMAFDEAWKKFKVKKENENNKLEKVIESISDHPFFLSNPLEARRVAQFRIRLLNLT